MSSDAKPPQTAGRVSGRRASQRRARLAVVGLALTVLAAACGGGDSDEDGEEEAVVLSPLAGEGCLNNTIAIGNDEADDSYLTAQRYISVAGEAEEFYAADGETWEPQEAEVAEDSNLDASYGLLWSIELHYPDDQVEEWKRSSDSGARYAVFRGKHVPETGPIELRPSTRDQANTHLSNEHGHRQDDWDAISDKIDEILADTSYDWYPEALDRDSDQREIAEKLALWIKNYRLEALMGPFGGEGGSNIDGFLHPADFVSNEPSFCQGAASTFVEMMAQLQIPARLGETNDHAWAEIFLDGEWLYVDNQPETFLHSLGPEITVSEFDGRPGYQPTTEEGWEAARQRSAIVEGSLIDIMADPASYGFIEGVNQFPWFFNWSNAFAYDADGRLFDNHADLAYRPEVYSDSVFNLYDCSYGEDNNHLQTNPDCPSESGRTLSAAQRLNSVTELAQLYPGRTHDLPYVAPRWRPGKPNVMFLTPIRGNNFTNIYSEAPLVVEGGAAIRKQFHVSDLTGVDEVHALLYLGPDNEVDFDIDSDGGDWWVEINGERTPLSDLNGMRGSDGSNGVEENYLGLGQTVLRVQIDPGKLHDGAEDCL